MAGAFYWHHGQLYRPAQNCLGTYGAGVVLQRVLLATLPLTRTLGREHCSVVLQPP
jgi:hypothetical protein